MEGPLSKHFCSHSCFWGGQDLGDYRFQRMKATCTGKVAMKCQEVKGTTQAESISQK